MEDRRTLWNYDHEMRAAGTIRKRAEMLEDALPEWGEYLRKERHFDH
jgi:hypothetical protein